MNTYGVFQERIQAVIDREHEHRAKRGYYKGRERDFSTHTVADFIIAVTRVTSEEDARAFYEGYVAWLKDRPDLSAPAEAVARADIGWCFGEGMCNDSIAMWVRACGASHPVFGQTVPSPEEAFRMGQQIHAPQP